MGSDLRLNQVSIEQDEVQIQWVQTENKFEFDGFSLRLNRILMSSDYD